jgi:hypothetical protein
MPERSVTDATGARWDVKEEPGGRGRDFRLSFRHQSGRRLDVPSRQGVNALSDRELLDMLARETGDREVTEGQDRSTDADGYITG